MAKHWSQRKHEPREWRTQILAGTLVEELAGDEGFSPAAEVFVGTGDPQRQSLLSLAPAEISLELSALFPVEMAERKAFGDLALAVARGADWSGGDALWELGWLSQAGRFGVGGKAFGILEARAPEGVARRCAEAIAMEMDKAARESLWKAERISRILERLGETPIPEEAGRCPQARALLESQLGSRGSLVRMEGRFASIQRMLLAAPPLKEAFGEEGVSEAFLKSLRHWDEDWTGLETSIQAQLSALPRESRGAWASKALARLRGCKATERPDCAAAVASLEAALADREAKGAPSSSFARRAL